MDNIKITLSFQKTDTGYKIKDITLDTGETFEKKIKKPPAPKASLDWLSNFSDEEAKEIATLCGTSPDFVRVKAADLFNYCTYKGKKYKDYRLFLINAVKKDKPVVRHADL